MARCENSIPNDTRINCFNIMYVIHVCVIRSCIVLNCVYNLRVFYISVEQMAVLFLKLQGNQSSDRRCGQALIIRDMDSLPRSISQCIRSHVVLFDMKMCYLTWAGLVAAQTHFHEENLHHVVDDS